jgi:HD-like signal output (HDOD) protein
MFAWLKDLVRSQRKNATPNPVQRSTPSVAAAPTQPAGPADLAGLPMDYAAEWACPAEPEAFPQWRVAIERVLDEQPDLVPPFPAAASRVTTLLRQPDVDLNSVVAALQQDPSLAAQVLTVANSGFFSGLGELASVRDAVMRLGLREINQVVTTAAMLALLDSGNRATGDRFAREWSRLTHHALTSGFAAGWLALERDASLYETAFMAGLLHDVGRVMALRAVACVLPPEATGTDGADHLVASLLEATHVACARRAFEAWHLPEAVRDVCLGHHGTAAELQSLPRAVHLVRIVSTLDELRTNPYHPVGAREELLESLRALGIGAAHLRPIHAEVRAMSEKAGRIVAGAATPTRRAKTGPMPARAA